MGFEPTTFFTSPFISFIILISVAKVKSPLKQTTPLQLCSAPFLNSPEWVNIKHSSDTVKNYGDRGECSAEADTTQQWRGGGGGGCGGREPWIRLGDPPMLVDVFHLQKLGPYFWKGCVWTFWWFEQNQHSRIFNQIIVSVAVDTVTTWSVPDMLTARHSNPTRIHSHLHLAYFVRCN